jgi:hypothetical protein
MDSLGQFRTACKVERSPPSSMVCASKDNIRAAIEECRRMQGVASEKLGWVLDNYQLNRAHHVCETQGVPRDRRTMPFVCRTIVEQ